MQFNKNIIHTMIGCRVAIAYHNGKIGWALYNSMIFKGSCTPQEINDDSFLQLRGMRPALVTFLAPGKNDQGAVAAIEKMAHEFRKFTSPPELRKLPAIQLKKVLNPARTYNSKSLAACVKEAVEADVVACPDNASALAVAVAMIDTGKVYG